MSGGGVKKFGWKRKVGEQISRSASAAFERETKNDDDVIESGDVDWLTLVPVNKKRVIGLEDNVTKAQRLIREGAMLAESERYWEALKKWDESLLFTPSDEKIYDMKAQALMELCEVFPAVQAAKKTVELAPHWWVAHQTLGRAFLGLGEVRLAVKSFSTAAHLNLRDRELWRKDRVACHKGWTNSKDPDQTASIEAVKSFSKAVHLNPRDRELWEEDLMWAHSLLLKREKLEEEKELEKKKLSVVKPLTVTEIDCEGASVEPTKQNAVEIYKNSYSGTSPGDLEIKNKTLRGIPSNYIQMRDK